MTEKVRALLTTLESDAGKDEYLTAMKDTSRMVLQWCKERNFETAEIARFLSGIGKGIPRFSKDPDFAAEFCKFIKFFLGLSFAASQVDALRELVSTVVQNIDDENLHCYAPLLHEYLSSSRFRGDGDFEILSACFKSTIGSRNKQNLCRLVLGCIMANFEDFTTVDHLNLFTEAVTELPTVVDESNEVAFEYITGLLWHIGALKGDNKWILNIAHMEGAKLFEKLADFLAGRWTPKNADNLVTISETPRLLPLLAVLITRHPNFGLKALEVLERAFSTFTAYFSPEDKEPLIRGCGKIGKAVFEHVKDDRDATVAKWFSIVDLLLTVVPNDDENTVLLIADGIFNCMIDETLVVEHYDHLEKILERYPDDSMTADNVMLSILNAVAAEALTQTCEKVPAFRKRVVRTSKTNFGKPWKTMIAVMNLSPEVEKEMILEAIDSQETLSILLESAETPERIAVISMLALEKFNPNEGDNAKVMAQFLQYQFSVAKSLLKRDNFEKILEWFNGCDEKILGILLSCPQVFIEPESSELALYTLYESVVTEKGGESLAMFVYTLLTLIDPRGDEEIDFSKWTIFEPGFEQLLVFIMCLPNTSLYAIANKFIEKRIVEKSNPPVVSKNIWGLFQIPESDSFGLLLKMIEKKWSFGVHKKDVFMHCMRHCGHKEAWKCAMSLLLGTVVDPFSPIERLPSFSGMDLLPDFLILAGIAISRADLHRNVAELCLTLIKGLMAGGYIGSDDNILFAICSLFQFCGGVVDGLTADCTKVTDTITYTSYHPFPYEETVFTTECPYEVQQEPDLEFKTFVNQQASLIGKSNSSDTTLAMFSRVCEIITELLLSTHRTAGKKDKTEAILRLLYLTISENPFMTKQEDKERALLTIGTTLSTKLSDPRGSKEEQAHAKETSLVFVSFACDRIITDEWLYRTHPEIVEILAKLCKSCGTEPLPLCVRAAWAVTMVRLVAEPPNRAKGLFFTPFLDIPEEKQALGKLWIGTPFNFLVCILFSTNAFLHNEDGFLEKGIQVIATILGMMNDKAFKVEMASNSAAFKAAIEQWRKSSFRPEKMEVGPFAGTQAGALYGEVRKAVLNTPPVYTKNDQIDQDYKMIITKTKEYLTGMWNTFLSADKYVELQTQHDAVSKKNYQTLLGAWPATGKPFRFMYRGGEIVGDSKVHLDTFRMVYGVPDKVNGVTVEIVAHNEWRTQAQIFMWEDHAVIWFEADSNVDSREVISWLETESLPLDSYDGRVLDLPSSALRFSDPKRACIVVEGLKEDDLVLTSATPLRS